MSPRVTVLIPATNKYAAFANPLVESMKRHFLPECDVEPIVFTNRPREVRCRTLPIEHAPWPGVTIHKYHYMCNFADELCKFDYIYMLDADMRMVAPIGQEVLGDLVAARHSAFLSCTPEQFPYDRNPLSAAFVRPGEGSIYAQACFFGGSSKSILAMSEVLASRIDEDERNGVVALWHDESHLNRYLIDHPPQVVLCPSYCFPEGSACPYEPKIVGLNKDHAVMRSSSRLETLLIVGRRVARRAGGALMRGAGLRCI